MSQKSVIFLFIPYFVFKNIRQRLFHHLPNRLIRTLHLSIESRMIIMNTTPEREAMQKKERNIHRNINFSRTSSSPPPPSLPLPSMSIYPIILFVLFPFFPLFVPPLHPHSLCSPPFSQGRFLNQKNQKRTRKKKPHQKKKSAYPSQLWYYIPVYMPACLSLSAFTPASHLCMPRNREIKKKQFQKSISCRNIHIFILYQVTYLFSHSLTHSLTHASRHAVRQRILHSHIS